MASVLGHQTADEGGLPDRYKAVTGAGGGKAVEQRVHEEHPAIGRHRNVMNVEIAGEVGEPWNKEPVRAVRSPLARFKRIAQLQDLCFCGKPHVGTLRGQPKTATHVPIEDPEGFIGSCAEK